MLKKNEYDRQMLSAKISSTFCLNSSKFNVDFHFLFFCFSIFSKCCTLNLIAFLKNESIQHSTPVNINPPKRLMKLICYFGFICESPVDKKNLCINESINI